MEKNIKDYLHYYLGCQVQHPALRNTRKLTGRWLQSILDKGLEVKPILRKLESMTEEEAIEGGWSGLHSFEYYCKGNNGAFHPGDFHYLLSKGFDLFGLIESGLAIEKQPTTLNQGV